MITLVTALLAAPTVIDNVRIEVGDGRVIERGSVVIDGNHIGAVGPGIQAATGNGVDLAGRFSASPNPAAPSAMFGALDEAAAASAGHARGGAWLKLRRLIEDTRFYQHNRDAFARHQTRDLILPPSHL